jgi:hypothetical protein
MTGTGIAAEVAAGIAQASAELSADGATPLTATITRPGAIDNTTVPPTKGPDTTYTATAIVSQYSARDRDGTQITARDVKVMLAVPLADGSGNQTEPRNGDTLAISDGRTYHVENVMPLQPGGVVLYWECQARMGG